MEASIRTNEHDARNQKVLTRLQELAESKEVTTSDDDLNIHLAVSAEP